jgi:hypothetical protein
MRVFSKALLALVFSYSCQPKNPQPVPFITLTVDGVAQEITLDYAILRVGATGNKERTLVIWAHSNWAPTNSAGVAISMSNYDFQNPPVDGLITKTYYDPKNSNATCQQLGTTTLCDAGIVTYLIYSSAFYNGPAYESTIKITHNDVSAKRISGEYDVKVQTARNTPNILTLKGKFDNVNYTIVNF